MKAAAQVEREEQLSPLTAYLSANESKSSIGAPDPKCDNLIKVLNT